MKKKSKTKRIKNNDPEIAQQKYDECVHVLGHLHNAVALALSITDEYDDKEATDLIQFALDEYKEFKKLSPEEVAQLKSETEGLVKQIKEVFPDIEIEMVSQEEDQKKRGLLN